VWSHFKGKGSALLLMLALADYADEEGRAWPGIDAIARKTRLSRRQIQRLERSLIEQGFLRVLSNRDGGAQNTKVLQLVITDVMHRGDADVTGDILAGVTNQANRGDIAVSPKPSYNHHKKKVKRTRALVNKALPEDFCPSDDHESLAADLGLNLQAEFVKFKDHHAAKGSTFKDWSAALRTWLRNAAAFRDTRVAAVPQPPPRKWRDVKQEWINAFRNQTERSNEIVS
jgi:hypothetical protein